MEQSVEAQVEQSEVAFGQALPDAIPQQILLLSQDTIQPLATVPQPSTFPQPNTVISKSETTSLHYPFPKHKNLIVGNLDNVYARIKQTRSGKPHVTGTLPLNVSPDDCEEIPETPVDKPKIKTLSKIPAPLPQVTQPETAQPSEEEKELFRKQRKKERRLARKAKKEAAEAGLVEAPKVSATPPNYKHNWEKQNLVTNRDLTDTYKCTKCGIKKKRAGLAWNMPEFGCTKE